MDLQLSAAALLRSYHSFQPPSSSIKGDKISLLFYGFVKVPPHYAEAGGPAGLVFDLDQR